jgi:hypothetical protein
MKQLNANDNGAPVPSQGRLKTADLSFSWTLDHRVVEPAGANSQPEPPPLRLLTIILES